MQRFEIRRLVSIFIKKITIKGPNVRKEKQKNNCHINKTSRKNRRRRIIVLQEDRILNK